jgi:hypothetical protein
VRERSCRGPTPSLTAHRSPTQAATTLLILAPPTEPDLEQLMELQERAIRLLEESPLHKRLQVVPFHPLAEFSEWTEVRHAAKPSQPRSQVRDLTHR